MITEQEWKEKGGIDLLVEGKHSLYEIMDYFVSVEYPKIMAAQKNEDEEDED